jgi:hypothetical protein
MNGWLMNWKRLEGSCSNLLEILFRHFPGRPEEFHEKYPSVSIAYVTKEIESSTSQIQVSSVISRTTWSVTPNFQNTVKKQRWPVWKFAHPENNCKVDPAKDVVWLVNSLHLNLQLWGWYIFFPLALQPQFGPWPTSMKLSVSLWFSRL